MKHKRKILASWTTWAMAGKLIARLQLITQGLMVHLMKRIACISLGLQTNTRMLLKTWVVLLSLMTQTNFSQFSDSVAYQKGRQKFNTFSMSTEMLKILSCRGSKVYWISIDKLCLISNLVEQHTLDLSLRNSKSTAKSNKARKTGTCF